ncbi:hypothetical protein GY45DRAFT_1369390 [Cubamyces sp. BRFM 1775]|nr:hypothetical protein GY45DRAFT_1369390 [Cubamyces sp. BRFM 1775]
MFNPFMQPASQTIHQPVPSTPTTSSCNKEERGPMSAGNAESTTPSPPTVLATAVESPAPAIASARGLERNGSMHSNDSVVSYATARQSPAPNENEESTDSPGSPAEAQPQTDEQGNTATTDANPVASSVPNSGEATNRGKTQTHFCPDFYTFGIRGGKGEVTEWYESHGPRARDAPPGPIRRLAQERGANIGCLHVHTHEDGVQAWMLDRAPPSPRRQTLPACSGKRTGPKLEWRRVHVGEPHPRLRGLVLHFLNNGEPRWVRPASAKKYAKDNKKRAATMAVDSDTASE